MLGVLLFQLLSKSSRAHPFPSCRPGTWLAAAKLGTSAHSAPPSQQAPAPPAAQACGSHAASGRVPSGTSCLDMRAPPPQQQQQDDQIRSERVAGAPCMHAAAACSACQGPSACAPPAEGPGQVGAASMHRQASAQLAARALPSLFFLRRGQMQRYQWACRHIAARGVPGTRRSATRRSGRARGCTPRHPMPMLALAVPLTTAGAGSGGTGRFASACVLAAARVGRVASQADRTGRQGMRVACGKRTGSPAACRRCARCRACTCPSRPCSACCPQLQQPARRSGLLPSSPLTARASGAAS